MKRILFYCQHVLGMGHLMRSVALVRELAQEFEISFLNGGELIPGLTFPPSVEVVHLPPIKSDEGFARLESVSGQGLEEVKRARAVQTLATYERWQPDIVVIELYPFGRKKFSFELLPLLARIRSTAPQTRIVCSLRDILVSRPQQASYEAQVCDLLNRYFDLLLVHADPQFQRLEESFSAVAEIRIPVVYTGYVAQSEEVTTSVTGSAAEDDVQLDERLPLLLASIGGGRVGYELLVATVEASKLLYSVLPHKLLLFGGPYLDEEMFLRLQELALDSPHILVRRFTSHFLSYMGRAELSISMAGYNTCVNILTTGVRALILPFSGGNNNEQAMRANKLAAAGVVTLLQPEDLEAERMQGKMIQALLRQPPASTLSIEGAAQTTARLTELAQSADGDDAAIAESSRRTVSDFVVLERLLPRYLQQLQEEERHLHCFLRDDDVDIEEESLRQLLDVGLSRGVPLNLAVIPGRLTPECTRLLKSYKKFFPDLLEFHQHGWQHLNHEVNGRKCEFGASRSLVEQREDIARGRMVLEEALGTHFFPAFTPPWNRCTPETLAVLDELDFKVFSRDAGAPALTGYGFCEISITLDFMAKGTLQMKSPVDFVEELVRQMEAGERIGIMLHHKMMDGEAFAFLDRLLAEMGRSPFIHFHTFGQLVEMARGDVVQAKQEGVVYR